MAKETKTNAARLLEKSGVKFSLNTYQVDENDLSATHVAEQLGVRAGLLFKTLVLHGERSGYFVCVVPGDAEVDLKKAAKVSGNKKADLIPMKDLLPLTGYIRGGCSPIGMKKRFPTYIDLHAVAETEIYISAGVRGLQIKIEPEALIEFLGATVSDIIV